MIAPARARYKIPLEWLVCAPRDTYHPTISGAYSAFGSGSMGRA